MPYGPRPEWIVMCGTCHRDLEWFICKTNANGNKGKWMARCVVGECCFFHSAYGQNGMPLQSPELSQGKITLQSPPQKKCCRAKAKCCICGCSIIHINVKCGQGVCARHFHGLGGCGLKDHAPLDKPLADDNDLQQDSHLDRDVLELSDNPTKEEEDQLISPPPPALELPSAPAAGPSNAKSKNHALDLPSSLGSAAGHSHHIQSKPPPKSMSNIQPKHSLQLPPFFTAQLERKHHLDEKQHHVTIHAFIQNGEPPSSFVFQTGFQWLHFYLMYEVLRELDLPATNLDDIGDAYQPSKLYLFDLSAGAWRGIHQDHMITLKNHNESLILRASDVTDCAGLDVLLQSQAALLVDPAVLNICEHLHADHASVHIANRAYKQAPVKPERAELALPTRLHLSPSSPALSSELEVEALLKCAPAQSISASPVHPSASPYRQLVCSDSVEVVQPIYLSPSPPLWHPSPSLPAQHLPSLAPSLTPPPSQGSAWTSHDNTSSDAIDLDDIKVWPADFHVVDVVEGFCGCKIARKTRRVSV
ncbi:uncharacterized protein EDB93DRAFT_1254574 [Suillus bovinus]|uniref:uncharacterized protein n=1 Tax=Suillus bovinus TaxID=48563 RepID=UPI001B86B339|nr:uncharacterized protein EDB93DRAFT_1254574 [Suillus bovinus]KAG2134150.1 hypothetical protein EDB93DRAFT_1254574 [Suillus bovinus]